MLIGEYQKVNKETRINVVLPPIPTNTISPLFLSVSQNNGVYYSNLAKIIIIE